MTQVPESKPETHSEALNSEDALEAQAKAFIYLKESSGNQYAINPTSGACGLGQALPCSKLTCELSDYQCQDDWFTAYAKTRYNGFVNAKIFWEKNGWW